MSSITNIITAAANKYGVAPWVAQDIAMLESSDNPNAVGDNGTSFGLFQLHWGGQGTGYTAAQLKDPVLNADIGVSHMAASYQKAVADGLTGFSLLDYVATRSGHPGYAGPGHYPTYESALQKVYAAQGGSTTGSTTTGAIVPTSASTTGSGSKSADALTVIDDAMKINGGWSLLNPVANARPVFFRVCIVMIGLACIFFGLFAIVKKAI